MAVLFWLIKLPAIDFNPPPWRRLFDTLPVSPWPNALVNRLPNRRSALNISLPFLRSDSLARSAIHPHQRTGL